jgi:inosine-uridine nucleoside N-ribohydrolase
VFDAPFASVTVVGLDASHQAALPPALWAAGERCADHAGRLLHEVYAESFSGRQERADTYLHDALAFAVALDPTLATYERGDVVVDVTDDRRGRTALRTAERGARIARSVDAERFLALLRSRLGLGS